MEPLISIIVPVYNTEAYLRQCIESICGQTYHNLEIIMVDDGSTDASGEICDEYAGRDSRIRVIHKENGGVTSARKAGLEVAGGTYAGFVDSDDWIEPDMYESLSKKMSECGADIVWSNAHWHKGEVAVLRHTSIGDGLYRSNQNFFDLMDNIIYGGCPEDSLVLHSLCNKLFKTELIRNAIYAVDDAVTIGEDHLALCIAVMRSEAVYVMQESFYHYRIHPVSAMRQTHRDYFLTLHYYYNGFRAAIEKFPQYQNTLSEQLAHLMIRCLLDGINTRFEWGFGINVRVPQYIMPIHLLPDASSIVLFGAGDVGKCYYQELKEHPEYRLAAWIDSNAAAIAGYKGLVHLPETIRELRYDTILLATRSREIAKSMENTLRTMGVPKEKIVWEQPREIVGTIERAGNVSE